MSTASLKVRLLLDLVNRLSGPAGKAQKSLRDVREEAKGLNRAKGGEQIARDLERARVAAARAQREVRALKRELSSASKAGSALNVVAMGNMRKREKAMTQGGGPGAAMLAAGRGALMPLAGAYGVYAGTRATVGKSVSFEKSMAEVKKKVDLPEGATFDSIEKSIRSTAIELGIAREEVAGLVAEAGAAGVPFQDLERWTRLAAKASVGWDMSARDASQKLAEIRAGTGMTLPEIEELADKINALGDNSAAKEGAIVEMFQRAGAAAKAAGVQFDASLAFLTALKSIGINEESASRGFNAFASTLRIATEKPKRVAEGLKMLGLTAAGVEKMMKTDATSAMITVLERLEQSTDKAKAAVKIFGQEWWDEVARAGQAIPEIRKSLDLLAQGKWRGSLDKGLNIQLSTTANHLERLKALSSEVGDRMGRWALPPINAAIERIIAGLNELDARAQGRKNEADDVASIAGNRPLSDEARMRMLDPVYRARVNSQVDGKRQDRRNLDVTNAARLADLEAERSKLSSSIDNRRRGGVGENQLAFSVNRLAEIINQIRAIDPSKAPLDARRPADQEDRRRGRRVEVQALKQRLAEIEAKIAQADRAKGSVSHPDDKAFFGKEITGQRARAATTLEQMKSALAPNTTAANRFGFGPGGAPAGRGMPPTGSGLAMFGVGGGKAGADWARKTREAFDIDFGDAGLTIMERLSSGLRSGQASAESAAGAVGDGVKARLTSVDATEAGRQVALSYADGIRSSEGSAVAAAQALAAKVKGALSSGGGSQTASAVRSRVSGALNDGVA